MTRAGDSSHFFIFNYLDPKLVVFLDAETRNGALKQLIDRAEGQKKLKNKEEFFQAIITREKIVSTGIGMGVALPHAKLPGYSTFFIVIGIHKRGIPWDSIDGVPVRLIFLIGGPDDKQTEYLQLLSRLTLAIKDEEKRKKMLQLTSPGDIIALFEGV